MLTLDPATRRALRARAHPLHPVVAIGQHGLTPAVLREIDLALKAHELIKVRVFSDDRAAREALLQSVCDALEAAPVQHLGKLLVLFRPRPDDDQGARPAPARHRAAAAGRPAGARAPRAASPSASPSARRPTQPRSGSKGSTGSAGAAARTRVGHASVPGEPARQRRAGTVAPAGVPRATLPRRRRRVG